ncbi:MAG TPA: DNA primase, partial [Rhodocyclaceae bacterium]
ADDPDSFVRQHGADAFRGFVRRALPLSEYLVQELARRHPPDSAEGRVALLHDAKPLLGKIASPAYRLQLVKRLGDITETTPGEIESLCGLRPVAALPAVKRVVRATPSLARSVARLILRQPALAAQLPDEALPGGTEGGALRALRDAAISGQTPTTAALIERLHGVADPRWLEALSAEVISHPLDDDACQTEFADALARLRASHRQSALRQLAERARQGTLSDAEKAEYLTLLRERTAPPSEEAGD